MKKTMIIALVFSLFSCESIYKIGYKTTFDGESDYTLSYSDKEKLSNFFGEDFINSTKITQADLYDNRDNAYVNGRNLAAIYCVEEDKIVIDPNYVKTNILFHEVAHRWQNIILKRKMNESDSSSGFFSILDVEIANKKVINLSNEAEASIVEMFIRGNLSYSVKPIYAYYIKNIMKIDFKE